MISHLNVLNLGRSRSLLCCLLVVVHRMQRIGYLRRTPYPTLPNPHPSCHDTNTPITISCCIPHPLPLTLPYHLSQHTSHPTEPPNSLQPAIYHSTPMRSHITYMTVHYITLSHPAIHPSSNNPPPSQPTNQPSNNAHQSKRHIPKRPTTPSHPEYPLPLPRYPYQLPPKPSLALPLPIPPPNPRTGTHAPTPIPTPPASDPSTLSVPIVDVLAVDVARAASVRGGERGGRFGAARGVAVCEAVGFVFWGSSEEESEE